MNKKIIAVFCVVILMVSVFSACGNKGYLLMKDENGFEHAYVTDENGSTVLNENGDIRVYETDANGKIVKDEEGKPKENVVKKPEYEAKEDKYETADFVLKITDSWKNAGQGKYVKNNNEDCFIEISKYFSDFAGGDAALEAKLVDTIYANEQAMENFEAKYPIASFEHGYKEICGKNMYLLEFYVEDENKNAVLYALHVYFVAGNNVYSIVYGDSTGKEYSPDFDFTAYVQENLTIKMK